ncbi:hypothetical protein [Oceanobacillus sp. J11TS1]|uniref:hypothetical protein n=1 Tax=Oceanobacillus sp. J11TS1 TaxID=2807191 RepID=UPI001AFEDA45|nr:hypothetical protein [Oceanobacillus sp. J11TS1]GIO22223.1 hypothetical protein J11TS1_08040 [Oceanobacillus sp. J11TS1]
MSKTTRYIGLITAPGYPNEIGAKLQEELPSLLAYYVKERIEWKINYIEDPLLGGDAKSKEILEATKRMREEKEWDYAICLTDLPLFKEKRMIVAEVNEKENIALISMPSFGSTLMMKRLRESIMQLVNEMYYGSSEESRERSASRIESKRSKRKDVDLKDSRNLMTSRFFGWLSPLKRETPSDNEDDYMNVRFTVARRGIISLRLLGGMVRANRPWSLFPAFMKIMTIAFATGSYALVFPTLWLLSEYYSIPRMFLLTFFSIMAMTIWIILIHHLWERKRDQGNNYVRRLYNATTFITLFITVCIYYVTLYCLFLVGVFVFIPTGMLDSQLSGEPGLVHYFLIAWIATSVSTVIGALGTALENEEVVLNATYGYRQRQRHEQLKKEREKEEEEKKDKERGSFTK